MALFSVKGNPGPPTLPVPFLALSRLPTTASMATAPNTIATPTHCPGPSLWSNTMTLKSMVAILRVTVIVTRVKDPYALSVTKMNNCPIAPVRPNKTMSNLTSGCERTKDNALERALKCATEVVGARKAGVRAVGHSSAAEVIAVENAFMKSIICGPSSGLNVLKTWSCVALTTPSSIRLIPSKVNPNKLLVAGPLTGFVTGLKAMNAQMPSVTRPTRAYLCNGNLRRYRMMFIIMTGTSLQDLPRSRVGNEMCESDKKPKGEAIDETNEMNAYSFNRSLDVRPSALRVLSFVSSFLCLREGCTRAGKPTTVRQSMPGFLLVKARKTNAEHAENADCTVLRNTTALNRSL